MTKMNRRDYLRGMGLAAGAFASWPTLDVLGKREIPEWSATADHKLGQAAPPTGLLRWIPTNDKPKPDAVFTAIFWGLMGFCYKMSSGSPVFEVGFHPGGNHHELSVTVLEIDPSGPTVKCSWHPKKKDKMTLKVIGRGDPPKVFQKEPFDRINGDEYDFRWLPDLDSRGFYPDPVPQREHFGARLEVSNGVLYTRKHTESTFNLVKADDDTQIIDPFGHVAMYMGLAIGVTNDSDSVRLEMPGEPPCSLEQKLNTRYQIVFKNECKHASCPSQATSNSPNEESRNHFHFMRKVLKLEDYRLKYSLKVDVPARPGAQADFYDPDALKAKQEKAIGTKARQEQAFVTDEAPCMGAGFGQTNGFPT